MKRLISEMKKCARTRKRLLSYLNGELGRRGRAGVEKHLEECAGCQREYQAERQLKELLASGIRREPDPLLTWKNLRPALAREVSETGRESRFTQLTGRLRTSFEEIALPKAGLAFAESVFWGKKAIGPAVIVLLAFISYNAFQTPTFTPEPPSAAISGKPPFMIKISFGPDTMEAGKEYYVDTGKLLETGTGDQPAIQYGWLRKEERKTDRRTQACNPAHTRV